MSASSVEAAGIGPALRGGIRPSTGGRPWTFYALAALFAFYVLALYGPMICIYILSFQDVRGGLVFPMKGISLHWFVELVTQVRTGDVKGSSIARSMLAVLVTVITVLVSFLASLGFRRRFAGDAVVFYVMIGSLVAPGLVLGLGTGLLFQWLGLNASWYTSALGAQLSWTLPFGVLVMFAVMSRFDDAWEEAARDLGASRWQIIHLVVVPILAPGLVAVALFGFTLSYDEFARSLQTARLAQHPAARDLEHDAQRHVAVALCARHGDDSGLLHRHWREPGYDRVHAEEARWPRRFALGAYGWRLSAAISSWPVSARAMTASPTSSMAST